MVETRARLQTDVIEGNGTTPNARGNGNEPDPPMNFAPYLKNKEFNMKAVYRGIAYKADVPAIEATETQQTGLFLGNRFTIKQYNVSNRQSNPIALKYRGIDYNA